LKVEPVAARTDVRGTPPHVCVVVLGAAVDSITGIVPAMLLRYAGAADQIRATVPAVCGRAIEVPL
jgi:hypothetical protein